MKRLISALLLTALPGTALAQQAPTPSFEDPRLQSVAYDPARPVRLVAFPDSTLTVTLIPDDRVERFALSDPAAFSVSVTGARDGLHIVPLRADGAATLLVDTSLRRYEFVLATGEGLAAAYLVRFVDPRGQAGSATAPAPPPTAGEYRLTGERALLPYRMSDDGDRTYLEWAREQSLPAVFGIGTNGEEEVVDGYMRDGIFTIDRVYSEVIFRIDDKRGRARRVRERGAR